MTLRCPLCQSGRFFVDTPEGTAFFALDEDGTPRDIVPAGRNFRIDPDTILFCSGCAWNGPLAELLQGS